LTRRGRVVLLAALVLMCGVFAIAIAGRGGADSPQVPVTAVVQPNDTLWSFSERHVPRGDRRVVIDDIRRINKLEGYVIHPGQRLVLPPRR
jgi:LysM repeat protein